MTESSDEKSINDTLSIIRKALKEENTSIDQNIEEVLVLNKLVKNDGTVENITKNNISTVEFKKILDSKLTEIFDEHLDKWLDKNIPNYLDKYLSKNKK